MVGGRGVPPVGHRVRGLAVMVCMNPFNTTTRRHQSDPYKGEGPINRPGLQSRLPENKFAGALTTSSVESELATSGAILLHR